MREDPLATSIDARLDAAEEELVGELTDELRSRVKSELEPGERLLWTGRNRIEQSAIGLGHFIAALIAAGLFVFTFLCLSFFNNRESVAVLALVTGLIGFLVVVGLLGSIGDTSINRGRDRSILYALTDRRAIIWMPDYRPRGIAVHSIQRGELARVHRVEYSDRSGDLRFGLVNPIPGLTTTEFTGIPEVRRVEQIVRNNSISDEKRAERVPHSDTAN